MAEGGAQSSMKAQIAATWDGTQLESGIERSKRSLADFGRTTQDAAQASARGLAEVGKAAAQVGDGASASVKRAAAGIVREIADLDAKLRGVTKVESALTIKTGGAEQLGPLLQQLKEYQDRMRLVTAAEQELAQVNAFEKKAAEAAQLARATEYVSWWTRALDQAEATEKRLADAELFARKAADAAQLVRASEYVRWWEQALQEADAREKQLADDQLFAKKLSDAAQLNRASEYVRWWTESLEQAEIQQRKTAQADDFLGSLKRQSDAIGKTRADLLEMEAARLGLTDKAAPFIARLREAETGFNGMGRASSLAARQLALVGPQLTDIVTQLSMGQSPLMILIQQGGQLVDVFNGSVTGALKGLGGVLLSVVTNPAVIAGAALGGLVTAYYQGAKEAEAYGRALILSGNAAGTTASQLQSTARAIGSVAGTQAQAAESLAALVGTGRVAAQSLLVVGEASVKMQRELGISAQEAAKQFAELGKDPLQASLRLTEQYRYLTASTYEQIRALEQQGRTADAARLAQETFAQSMSGRMDALNAQLGTIERAWRAITEEAKRAWSAMLNIGRPETTADALAAAQQQLAAVQGGKSRAYVAGGEQGQQQALATAQQEVNLLSRRLLIEDNIAASQAASAEAMDARISLHKEFASLSKDNLDKKERERRLEQEITGIRERGVKAGYDQAKIDTLVSAKREEYKKAAGSAGANSANRAEVEAVKETERLKLEEIKRTQMQVDALRTTSRLGEREAIQQTADLDLRALQTKRAALLQEAQIVAKKDNAEGEARALRRQAAEVDEQIDTRRLQLKLDLEVVQERLKRQSLDEVIRQQADAQDEETRAIRDASVARTEYYPTLLDQERALDDQGRLMALEVSMLGQSDTARKVAVETLRIQLRLERELEDIRLKRGNDPDAIRKATDNATKEAAQAQARVYLDEWTRTTDQIGQALTNALMAGGKSGAEYVRGLFRTMVLQPVLKAVVQPVAGPLAAALTPGFSSATGALNAASSLNSLSGLYSAITGGVTSSIASVIGGAGSLFGSSALSAFATGMQGSTLAAGLAGPTTAGATGAMGLGASFSAALPWVGGALALYSLAKAFDSGGTPHVGAAVQVDAGGNASTWSGNVTNGNYSQATADALGTLTQSVVSTANALAKAFGGTGGYTAQSRFAADGQDASYGEFLLRNRAGTLAGYVGNGVGDIRGAANTTDPVALFSSNGEEGFKQYATAVAKSLRDALMAEAPSWADTILASLGDAPALEAVQAAAQQIAALQQAFANLGAALGLTEGQVVGLSQVFGGVDAFATGVQSYVSAIYSDSEKLAFSQGNLQRAFDRLGVSVPSTAEAYRALVEQQDLNTEAGKQMYAALVQLAPAYEQVQQALDQQVQAATQAAQAIAQQRAGLEQQLLQLQGNTAALRERELAALDASNRALQQQIYALQDQQAAAQAAATAQEAEAQRLAALTEQRAGLEQQIMQMLGDTSGLRERELAALDPSLRALQQRVYMLQDEQSAAQGAAQVQQQRAGLEQTLLQLQGDTAALRARELAALDPANRALQEQIYALQDQQKAAQEAADAAQKLKDAWASVGSGIADEIERIRGLDGAGGKTFAQLQSEFAITTAQARAGDQTAASTLPTISRAMLDAAEGMARSSAELARIRGATAASLQETLKALEPLGVQVPAFASGGMHAGGWALVGEQGPELLNLQPSRIYNAGDTAQMLSSSSATAEEVRALRQELAALREDLRTANAQIARNTGRVAKVLETVAPDGDAINTRAAS